jgi:hypothetical protein
MAAGEAPAFVCTNRGAHQFEMPDDPVVRFRAMCPGGDGDHGNCGNLFSVSYGRSIGDHGSIPTSHPQS